MALRLFPPRWRRARKATRHLGLAFSPGRLAAAVVEHRGAQRPALLAHQSFVDDPRLSLVRQWLDKLHMEVASVNLLLTPSDYQILPLESPQVPAAERAEAARWRIKDMLSFPVEDANIDCIVVPAPDGSLNGHQAWAVVARRERVREWVHRAKQAKLIVDSVDIPELALRNLLALEPGPNAAALLRVSSVGCALNVVWKGELCGFRRFDDMNSAHFANTDLQTRQATLERLGLEIQRTADAFERQFYNTSIDRVWVEQSIADVDLVRHLAPHVSLRLQPLRLEDSMDVPDGLLPRDSAHSVSLIAVGAALRHVLLAREQAA